MRYTDELLDSLRLEGDPVPDKIIEELARTHSITEVNNTLRNLNRNDQAVPVELPDVLETWLRDKVKLPPNVSYPKLKRASDVFVEHGLTITMLLSTAGLVGCYAAAKGAKVLNFSYRLNQEPYRRVAESGQFVLLAMSPGGLLKHGSGIRAIQKVRLMHSAIRYLILQTGRWKGEELGVPICQEDILGTLMVFSYCIITGMRRLGMDITDQQAEDYLYAWRMIGRMLGVREDIIPQTMEEADEATTAIFRRHHRTSPEGVYLTQALLEMHAGLIPGTMFDGTVPALIRYILGDDVAKHVELPPTPRWDHIFNNYVKTLQRVLDAVDDFGGPLSDVLDQIAVAMLMRTTIQVQNYQHEGFEIPTQLRQLWIQQGKIRAGGG